jgi:glucuronate isomerase
MELSPLAAELYHAVRDVPLICPHGHVNPRLLADPAYAWGTPVDVLIIPDHYVFRMLYSQGIPLPEIGIPARDGTPPERDHRLIWRRVAENWYLFRGTPTGYWIRRELADVFGITEKLDARSADRIYDQISTALADPRFSPRRLFERFNIEVLATTDAAADSLREHQQIRESGWGGRVIPTFRPDKVVLVDRAEWKDEIAALSAVTGISITNYRRYIQALESRRAFFKQMGAVATDHDAATAYTEVLSEGQASTLFDRALRGTLSPADAQRFTGHMLVEMARMSVEDGLVMQLHVGSVRNHNGPLFERFGRDMGADIPAQAEFTHNLRPLLNRFGNQPDLRIILFTLDESTYSRELAPLAGHYPALRLGPPWWFHDSPNGMRRYFDQVMETAGLYNTVGFNDDTRAFPSIPARHDLWRRASADWVAGLLQRGLIDAEDAAAMMHDLAYGLAKRGYKL